MEFTDVVRRRRMVRSFADAALAAGVVDSLVTAALRAPTAGNARGTAFVVLEGPDETERYWRAATTAEWRATSPRWAGLSRAAAVVVSLASPDVYVHRYGEPDKVRSGLGPPSAGPGGGPAAWPVPYWFGDAAFGVMTLLLAATDAGVAACFLGSFRGESALLAELGAPDGWRVFGAVALGHPDGGDHRSRSLTRTGPADGDRLHHGRWSQGGAAATARRRSGHRSPVDDRVLHVDGPGDLTHLAPSERLVQASTPTLPRDHVAGICDVGGASGEVGPEVVRAEELPRRARAAR